MRLLIKYSVVMPEGVVYDYLACKRKEYPKGAILKIEIAKEYKCEPYQVTIHSSELINKKTHKELNEFKTLK